LNSPVPECLSCGACCFGGHDRYIQLFDDDLARGLPEAALHRVDGQVYMAMRNGHCAQLVALPGGALACGVYAARPTACRAFRAGSFECGRARHHRMAEADALRLPEPANDDLPPEIAQPA